MAARTAPAGMVGRSVLMSPAMPATIGAEADVPLT
jgi:hypothetical protein